MSRRHPAFPNVGPLEMVGPLSGRRFMESFNDTTLQGMSRGQAGEPEGVVTLARQILRERQAGPSAPIPGKPSISKTGKLLRRREFQKLMREAHSENKVERAAARHTLKQRFGKSFD